MNVCIMKRVFKHKRIFTIPIVSFRQFSGSTFDFSSHHNLFWFLHFLFFSLQTEPGYYEDDEFGIRIEDIMYTVEADTDVRIIINITC